MSLSTLNETFKTSCENGEIPGVLLFAANKTGTLNYEKSFGLKLPVEGQNEPLPLDQLMALTSGTKLITTIACLQMVERGMIGLDDDVTTTLTEIANLEILSEMQDGKAVLKKRKKPITLRHLLTHSSGTAYPMMVPLLQEYNKSLPPSKSGPPKTVAAAYSAPLLFEPGTSWKYSPGLDWAGVLVSRLTSTTLQEYFQQHIFNPCGIKDITFRPDDDPALAARKASMSTRDPSGKLGPYRGPLFFTGHDEEMGGQGAYASLQSYFKILQSLLMDDEKLLKAETAALMFEPQLTKEAQEELQRNFESWPTAGPCSVGYFPPKVKLDWGLGGMLTMEDVVEDGVRWRRAGCLAWTGMVNLFWFVDRAAGICGLYGTQLLPSGDPVVKKMTNLFEKTIYAQVQERERGTL
ncbi:beta-lactamase/transpeptidase-like protein [Leptodontidium sp. 2 PMI_412]|nr:beta-lactamase/transpeptidase-like protein [Leptodontidium sp. 2 PMI_412]